MNPSLPPTRDDQDNGQEANVVLTRKPGEVWHLARLQAYRHAQELTQDRIVYEALSAAADASWNDFIAAAALTPEHLEDLATYGPPDEIAYNPKEGATTMAWSQRARSEHMDAWGTFKVRPSGVADWPEIDVSTPFRHVELERLPAGTLIIPIHDPRHTATAAVEEIIELIQRDMKRALARYQGEEAWRALRSHASFLAAGARTALESIADDSFRDWSRPRLSHVPFESIPERVTSLGLTTRAQQALALHFVSQAYAQAQEEADARETDPVMRSARLTSRIAEMASYIHRLLETMNEGVIATTRSAVSKFTTMFVFRPIPASVPVLAVIPTAPA